jgi:hypothetical protein
VYVLQTLLLLLIVIVLGAILTTWSSDHDQPRKKPRR